MVQAEEIFDETALDKQQTLIQVKSDSIVDEVGSPDFSHTKTLVAKNSLLINEEQPR